MKKLKNVLTILIMTAFVWGAEVMQIMAQEDSADAVSELNQIMTVQEDCDAREHPKESRYG